MEQKLSVFRLKEKFLEEKDKEKREKILEQLTDEKFLEDLLRDSSKLERVWAISMIKSQDILKFYAINDETPEVRRQATSKIEDEKFLKERAVEDSDSAVRITAMSQIKDQKFLYDIATNHANALVKQDAAECLTAPELIAEGIINGNYAFSKKIKCIKSERLLCKIYFESQETGPKILATKHMKNIPTLLTIALTSEIYEVRETAIERITSIIE